MWINTQTKTVYRFHWEIRAAFPDVSMPALLSDNVLSSIGVALVRPTNKPQGIVVEEVEPVLQNNVWIQQWRVREHTAQETEEKSLEVRSERNRLLSESDWTQVGDSPVDKLIWSQYRSQLRDITMQPGFPWSVEWPISPDSASVNIHTNNNA